MPPSNFELRGATFYLRVRVPAELQALRSAAGAPGPKEVKRSLRAGSRRQARVAATAELAKVYHELSLECARLRASAFMALRPLTDHDISDISSEMLRELRLLDERDRLALPDDEEVRSLVDRIDVGDPAALRAGCSQADRRLIQAGCATQTAALSKIEAVFACGAPWLRARLQTCIGDLLDKGTQSPDLSSTTVWTKDWRRACASCANFTALVAHFHSVRILLRRLPI